MIIESRHFGKLEIEDEKTITFEEGLPGFEEYKRFALLKDEKDIGTENDGLFWYLQAVDNPDTAFVLMDVLLVMPDYNPLIDPGDIECLGEYDPDSFFVYNVVVIPDDINKLSVNLKAPIVISEKLKKGKQVVANNEEYTVRHFIFEEQKELAEVGQER